MKAISFDPTTRKGKIPAPVQRGVPALSLRKVPCIAVWQVRILIVE